MDILVTWKQLPPPTLQPPPNPPTIPLRGRPPGLDLTIKASGTHQGLIQDVGTVGGSDHHHTLATFFFTFGCHVGKEVQDAYGHKHMGGSKNTGLKSWDIYQLDIYIFFFTIDRLNCCRLLSINSRNAKSTRFPLFTGNMGIGQMSWGLIRCSLGWSIQVALISDQLRIRHGSTLFLLNIGWFLQECVRLEVESQSVYQKRK